jgi:hypothetical protein
MATEAVVHKKGWREGTEGKGVKRAIDDQTFEDMCRQLKGCDWECSLNVTEIKKLDATGQVPAKLYTKMNLCFKVGA